MEEGHINKSENVGGLKLLEKVISNVKISEPFMEEGDSSDEIVLIFENGGKLFVSENFLSYASPVFQAMFRQDFKEKETREVALKEKKFEDFREFLLCLHPGIQKPVDRNNMLKILSLANEYQVESLLRECKQTIEAALLLEIQSAYKKNLSQQTTNYQEALGCLEILKAADENGLDDIISFTVVAIAKFGYKVFSGTKTFSFGVSIEKRLPAEEPIFKFSHALVLGGKPQTSFVSYRSQNNALFGTPVTTRQTVRAATPVVMAPPVQTEAELRSKCKTLYDSLSLDLKNKILLERIKHCDDNRFTP